MAPSVPLRVLGDRVLVKPAINPNAPETLESGVVVAHSLAAAVTGQDPTNSLCRGLVVAIGSPQHPLRHEAESLALAIESRSRARSHGHDTPEIDAARMLRDLVRRQPCVAVNDDVLFSHDAGQETVVDHETYVILHEHELLAVIVPETTGA